MKCSALLILWALDWNGAAAFTPSSPFRRRFGVGEDCHRKQRDNVNVPLFLKQEKRLKGRYKTRPFKKQSPEYRQALDSLLLCSDAHIASLSPRELVDLTRDLARRGHYETLLELAKKHPHMTEAAIISLSNASPKFRHKALDLVGQQNITLTSSRACVALFRCVKGPSAAVSLLQRLQTWDIMLPNDVEVWNAAIYASRENWQTALTIMREMRKQGVLPDERSYANVLHACAQSGQVRIALTLLEEISSSSSSPQIWGAALNACAKAGSVKDALTVLKDMRKRSILINTVHVGALLSALANAGNVELALDILHNFTRGTSVGLVEDFVLQPIPLDLVAINTVLAACAKADYFDRAKEILEQLKNGDFEGLSPDVISYNTVLSACSDPNEAKLLVKEMRMSRRYRHGAVPPTSITYTHAITACRQNEAAVRFFLDLCRDDGMEPNVYMYSAAIWTCPDAALDFWEEMGLAGCAPNIVSYNGVISALASQGRAEEALSLYEELKDNGLQPNRVTFQVGSLRLCYCAVIHSNPVFTFLCIHFQTHSMQRLASAIRQSTEDISRSEMLEHVLTLMSPSDMRASIGGAILEALIRQYGAGGKYLEARRIFDQIVGPLDAYCLRAILYACSAGEPPRWEDALSILHTSDIVEGTRGPAKMDAKALSYAMLACAKADQWEEALNIAELYGRAYSTSRRTANPNGYSGAVTLPAFNALIAACGRCGQPGMALRVLNDMETMFGVAPDELTYRKAIIACNQAEHDKRRRKRRGLDAKDDESALQWWECALSLLRRMKESHLQVDPQTYSSVISACEAAGQWQRALGVLRSMMKTKEQATDDYSRLNLYCFNAAVSACEKGGAWVEALELYYRMKDKGGAVTPNFVTLNSLLVALDTAGQKELAQSTYEEGVRDGVVTPWKMTRGNAGGQMIRAMVSATEFPKLKH